jgi:hypothetical protein
MITETLLEFINTYKDLIYFALDQVLFNTELPYRIKFAFSFFVQGSACS